jgi:hypothetical protein
MPDAAALERVVAEWRLMAVTDAIDRAVDDKDWDEVRSFFADELLVSLPGAEPGAMSADDLVGAFQANLYEEKASFHLRGNHLVTIDGDSAIVRSSGYAWNRVEGLEGGDLWEVWDHYEHRFERRDGD